MGPRREPDERPWRRLLENTWQVQKALAATLAETPEDARVVDLGAGGRRVRPGAVCVDLLAGPDVDVVADIHSVPLPDAAFELAICTGTLNLCREPAQVVAELFRLLVPGGRVHLEVGLFQPYTPEPEDYWRFTLPGLRLLMSRAGFREVRSGAHMGPMSAVAASATYLAGGLFPGRRPLARLIRGGSHLVFGPMKYLDRLIDRDLGALPFVYGIYFVGEKPSR
jgi:hypothetical protein